MDRHDLIYLHPQGRFTFLDASLPEGVQHKVKDMIAKHVPFTVCRQEPYIADDSGVDPSLPPLKVATSCLYNGRKYRVALSLSSTPLLLHKPLPLIKILNLFDAQTQTALALFIQYLNELDCDVCVYGSFSNAYFTQEEYTHAASDLDLLLLPHTQAKLSQILQQVQLLQAKVQLKIDGELQLSNAESISFNELINALKQQQQQIVVKGFRQISMQKINELLGWNAHEFKLCVESLQSSQSATA